MNGWAYVGAALITALAVAGVGYITNLTSLNVADAARLHAEEQRLWDARKEAYFRVMQWIHATINDLAPWKYALTHGHPDRPTSGPTLPEPLPEEIMAQVWTVGSQSIIDSVYGANTSATKVIGLLQQLTWTVPPAKYAEAVDSMGEAEASLRRAINVIRRDMRSEPFSDPDVQANGALDV